MVCVPRSPLSALSDRLREHRNGGGDHLATHPLFAPLARRDRARAASMCDVVNVGQGKLLARQGAQPIEAFVIGRGEALVYLDAVPIARLDRRQTVGVAARYHGIAFGSAVVSATDMELYVIQPRCLRSFVELVPQSIAEDWCDFAPLPAAGADRAPAARVCGDGGSTQPHPYL